MEDGVAELERELSGVKEQVATVQKGVDTLTSDIADISSNVAGLVEAWNTSLGVVKFMKWIAAPVTVITTIAIGIMEYLKYRG